jgi:pimeloyl-ACP methyl ester carboxylesterase
VGNTCVANRPVALARDITAPLAYASLGNDREWITDFLQPGTNNAKDGLMMIEPYQPGKIPVLMVHGLLSDPSTWADLANELRAHPDLNDRYQWWAFRYASGEPFLRSAGELRRQLVEVRETYDPQRRDPALSQIVVVGHSMGGLIAKLQVTESGDRLWNSTAKIPLASVRTSEQTRQQLQSEYFFRPSSDITRVVFIGTPHQGSVWAQRPVGRIASAMVETPPEREAQFKQVMRDNPGASRNISDGRFPTSIDLLKPSNELLVATAQLPYSDRVRVHSIIGTRRTTWKGEPSDGVVPVSSARLLNVTSEKLVDEVHTDLQRNPESVAEVIRILRIHLAERDFDSHESASMVGSIVTAQ